MTTRTAIPALTISQTERPGVSFTAAVVKLTRELLVLQHPKFPGGTIEWARARGVCSGLVEISADEGYLGEWRATPASWAATSAAADAKLAPQAFCASRCGTRVKAHGARCAACARAYGASL
jgi:hypothetical protein